jgi:2-C-methyl-D-erythritol 4-phosphate cytidylyltransferase
MSHNITIIAAGGRGTRMGSDLPKQYQLLNGKPVLMHTREAFAGITEKIIVVTDPKMTSYWTELCQTYNFTVEHVVVPGGKTRFASVKNGLAYIRESYPKDYLKETAIAVHDGARPLISHNLIRQSFEMCHQGLGNVLGVRSINSVRLGTESSSEATDREQVWLIQTPQTFPANVLLEAFTQDEHVYFTDEASVVEKLGYNIHIIESSPINIKITYPEDLVIAHAYTKN